MKKTVFAVCGLLLFCLILNGCGRSAYRPTDAGPMYLKNNLHVQEHTRGQRYRASYTNWTNPGIGHRIVPVNTQILAIDNYHHGLTFTTNTGMTIYFEFDERAARMTAEQYISLITSSKPVSLDTLSELDRKGIQEGKVYPGMTKDGVRIAFGYPGPNQTPSLESNTWVYWTNRFKPIKIEFDETGLAK